MKDVTPSPGNRFGQPPSQTVVRDRWAIKATLLSFSGGLAVVECVASSQLFGVLPAYRLTLEWRTGMEPCDVEAEALIVSSQSLACLRQTMIAEAVEKIT